MIFVIAAAVTITCLSLVMRYATLKTDFLWGVILGNYLIATVIMAVMVLGTDSWGVSPFTLGLGLASYPADKDPDRIGLKTIFKLVEGAVRGRQSRS